MRNKLNIKMAVQVARIESGRVHVDMEALGGILDKVGATPVVVVAVSGPLQIGKSSIAQYLLHKLSSPLVEGLWKNVPDQPNEILMWPDPLVDSQDYRSSAVLLMSIHGNLDGTITSMENALIFVYGCLVASVTVYNVKNGISEDMLQLLQLVVSSAKKVSQQEDFCAFAKLLFAINDWQLPGKYAYGLHEDGNKPFMRNFKKEMLDGMTGIMPESRVARQVMLSSFQEVSCCLMPNFDDETVEGLEQLQDVTNWIFRDGNSIIKTIRGREVTGTEVKLLVQEWADSLVITNILIFTTGIEGPGELPNAVALSVALKFFREEMASAITVPKRLTNDQLGEVLNRKKREAVAMFERMTSTEQEALLRRYVSMLEAELDELGGTFPKMKTEMTRCPQQPVSDPVRIQMRNPILADLLCTEKTSDYRKSICWVTVLLHMLLGAAVILWLTCRTFA